jgi:hypothetical protein
MEDEQTPHHDHPLPKKLSNVFANANWKSMLLNALISQ